MVDKSPEIKLNPEAMPWGRSVEKRLGNTESKARIVASETAAVASSVTTVQQDVAAAQNAVNNKLTFSTDPASGTNYNENDTWFQRNVAGEIIAQWSFVGGKWESRTLSNSVIANLDAGKITAGILNAALVTISTGGLTGQRIALDATGLKGYDAFGALKTSVGTDGSLAAVDATLTGVYKTAVSGRRVEINPSVISAAGIATNQAAISFVFRDPVLTPADSGYPAGSIAYTTYDSKLTSYFDTVNKKATTVVNGPAFATGVASPSGGGSGTTKRSGSLTFEQSWTGSGTSDSDFAEDSLTTLTSDSILVRSTAYPGGIGVDIQSPTKIHLGRSTLSSADPAITIGDTGSTAPVSIAGPTTVTGTLAATTSVAAPRHLVGTRQYSVPEVASSSARDSLFSSPVNGDRCYRTDVGWEEAYFSASLAGTAGWYPTAGKMPMIYYESNGNTATSGTYMVLPVTTISNAGSTILTRSGNVITVNLSGYYDLSIQALWGTNTAGSRGVAVYLNGAPFPAPVRASGVFADDTGLALSSRVYITAGSQITAIVRQSSGATLGVAGRFGITWVMPGVAPA